MQNKEKRRYFWIAAAAALAGVLQLVGLVRYANRLPDDWVGITLYVITIVAFAIASLGAYLRARQAK